MKGSRFRLLPMVIVVALAMLTIRLGSLWEGFSNGASLAHAAPAAPTGTETADTVGPNNGQPQPMLTAGTRPLDQVMTTIPPTAPADAADPAQAQAQNQAPVQVAQADTAAAPADPSAPNMAVNGTAAAPNGPGTTPSILDADSSDQVAQAEPAAADKKPKDAAKPKKKEPTTDAAALSYGSVAPDPLQPGCANYSDGEVDLLQKLSQRREVLDQRENELNQRQALMSAAEDRINKKIADLQQLQGTIQDLLKQTDAQEQAKIDQLVKMYASMKPADAARIFNQLDMPILITIMSTMKESKSAPILAAMDSDKARSLTEELSRRRSVPIPPA